MVLCVEDLEMPHVALGSLCGSEPSKQTIVRLLSWYLSAPHHPHLDASECIVTDTGGGTKRVDLLKAVVSNHGDSSEARGFNILSCLFDV